jgi:ferredoxin
MLSGLLFDRLTADSRPAVLFKPRRCLRARFSGSNCHACIEECQSGALTLNGKAISFDDEKCTGCLRCKAICPNDALTDDIDIKLLLETIGDKEKVVLSCLKNRQCEGKIRIPCIGFLSEPLLVAINVLTNKNVIIDVERCGGCVNGHCLDAIQDRLSNILSRATNHTSLKIKLAINDDDIPAIDRKTARRFFLKDAGKAIVNISASMAGTACVSQSRIESQFEKFPIRNSAGLQIAFAHATDESDKMLLRLSYYKLAASKECNSCPMCSGMCPTGALKRKKVKDSNQLVFTSARCSGCGLCVDFCKKKALTLLQGANNDPEQAMVIVA